MSLEPPKGFFPSLWDCCVLSVCSLHLGSFSFLPLWLFPLGFLGGLLPHHHHHHIVVVVVGFRQPACASMLSWNYFFGTVSIFPFLLYTSPQYLPPDLLRFIERRNKRVLNNWISPLPCKMRQFYMKMKKKILFKSNVYNKFIRKEKLNKGCLWFWLGVREVEKWEIMVNFQDLLISVYLRRLSCILEQNLFISVWIKMGNVLIVYLALESWAFGKEKTEVIYKN